MTDARAVPVQEIEDEGEPISLFAVASVLLRWRRTIIALALLGGIFGLARGLASTRLYRSTATFVPQGSEGGASGLALAASQFGIALPSSGSGWGPPMYLELLRSPVLLEPVAFDTVVVAEKGGQRVSIMDLLGIKAPTAAERSKHAVDALRGVVSAWEDKKIGAVKLSVTTKWPSVSFAIAQRLVRGVNEFNLETRKSQAAAERQFVEGQAREAERALRVAEDRFQLFLQRNRVFTSSPELGFEHDRLQREVALRQQVFTTLLQSLEDARIREVRDTPVITVLDSPRVAIVGEPRGTKQKAILGGLAGGVLGVVLAFLSQWLSGLRRARSPEASEFFEALRQAVPRLSRLRR